MEARVVASSLCSSAAHGELSTIPSVSTFKIPSMCGLNIADTTMLERDQMQSQLAVQGGEAPRILENKPWASVSDILDPRAWDDVRRAKHHSSVSRRFLDHSSANHFCLPCPQDFQFTRRSVNISALNNVPDWWCHFFCSSSRSKCQSTLHTFHIPCQADKVKNGLQRPLISSTSSLSPSIAPILHMTTEPSFSVRNHQVLQETAADINWIWCVLTNSAAASAVSPANRRVNESLIRTLVRSFPPSGF